MPVGRAYDLLVVGGGFLGLSTALCAARAGLGVLVVDAGRIGDGASGLNGGQVIPGLKYDPDSLKAKFGEDQGDRLTRFVAGTADSVFSLIAEERLSVPFTRTGWIQAAHTEAAMAAIAERHRQWSGLGADVALLDSRTIAEMTGGRGYLGGYWDRRAGAIDPLSFVTELARIATEAGVTIAEHCRAIRLDRRSGQWEAALTRGGPVSARRVVVGVNAHADDLVPGLRKSLIPLHSFQIATGALPDAIDQKILPGGQAVSDSRRILVYYRKTADRRMILGGRGRMSVPKGAADWRHIERALVRLYPDLSGMPIERRWFGRVCVTLDGLPHLHEPEKGLAVFAGCQGRGVGLMTAMGRPLADYAATGDRAALPFPVTPIRPIPFHAFRRIGVTAAITWYRMLDAFEG